MSENQLEKFAKRLKMLLVELRYTQNAFSSKLGYENNSTISRSLSGKTHPTLKLLFRMYDEFPEVNYDWLLTGRGNAYLDNLPKVEENRPGYEQDMKDLIIRLQDDKIRLLQRLDAQKNLLEKNRDDRSSA